MTAVIDSFYLLHCALKQLKGGIVGYLKLSIYSIC